MSGSRVWETHILNTDLKSLPTTIETKTKCTMYTFSHNPISLLSIWILHKTLNHNFKKIIENNNPIVSYLRNFLIKWLNLISILYVISFSHFFTHHDDSEKVRSRLSLFWAHAPHTEALSIHHKYEERTRPTAQPPIPRDPRAPSPGRSYSAAAAWFPRLWACVCDRMPPSTLLGRCWSCPEHHPRERRTPRPRCPPPSYPCCPHAGATWGAP